MWWWRGGDAAIPRDRGVDVDPDADRHFELARGSGSYFAGDRGLRAGAQLAPSRSADRRQSLISSAAAHDHCARGGPR